MSQDQNDAPVGGVPGQQTAVKHFQAEKVEKQKQYYVEQARRFCPTLSPQASESLCLYTLLRKTQRMIRMLTYFDRPWENGMPEVQKACLTFLATYNLSKKERLRFINKWDNWTEFLLGAAHYRNFISQLLQDYHRQLSELERLVGPVPSDPSEIAVPVTE